MIRQVLFQALDAAGSEQGAHLGDGVVDGVVSSFQCSVFREEEEVPSDQ